MVAGCAFGCSHRDPEPGQDSHCRSRRSSQAEPGAARTAQRIEPGQCVCSCEGDVMSWRLEPTPRAEGIDEGLAARIHDPLWLLARQWQMGEFRGQDAGTPALVQVAGSNALITAW